MSAWEYAGIGLPHNTQAMVDSGHLIRIRPGQARKGDIVMFSSGGVAYHAGLVQYKNRWMVDAPHSGAVVRSERIEGSPAFYRVRR